LLQIHQGDQPIDWAAFTRPVIPVIRPKPGVSIETLERPIGMIRRSGASVPAIMVDAWHPTLAGGTGEQSDWEAAARLALHQPLILAGGLKPETVAEAIATVRPFGVDVSSGVETGKVKDPAKITAFVQNAIAAFQATM
jgi:phosphoribosylanthranilate isomerase